MSGEQFNRLRLEFNFVQSADVNTCEVGFVEVALQHFVPIFLIYLSKRALLCFTYWHEGCVNLFRIERNKPV